MILETGTGKYEQLLERCSNLEPVPTAVAHPCDASSFWSGGGSRTWIDRADSGWPVSQDN